MPIKFPQFRAAVVEWKDNGRQDAGFAGGRVQSN